MLSKKEIYLSEYLVPLQQFGKTGMIHSVFDRSFNLEINGQLINIACFHDYLSSFGINLPEERFQSLSPFVQIGNRVKISQDMLMIYSTQGVKKSRFNRISRLR